MEGAFRDPDLKLIETFAWTGGGFPRLQRHINRMKKSAQALGFPFELSDLYSFIPTDPGPLPRRLRLTLDRNGWFDLTSAALTQTPAEWRVRLASARIASHDPRLRHKTTDRALYDTTRAALPEGVDELIFLNERGEVAEGTITNIFFDLGEGLQTPPLSSGCLPGCLREELLETGQVYEGPIHGDDLPRARLWVGNSLRGLISARLL